MASEQLFGETKFTWNTGADEHLLRVPLQQIRAAGRSRSFVSESLDYTVRQVITIGQVHEIVALIRYDDDPTALVEFLFAGISGEVITYDDGTNQIDCYLIEPTGEEFDLDLEDDANIFRENSVEVRLRKTDGSAFTELF